MNKNSEKEFITPFVFRMKVEAPEFASERRGNSLFSSMRHVVIAAPSPTGTLMRAGSARRAGRRQDDEAAMETYPEKTCSIDRLVTHPKLVAAAKAGMKTQQRRNGVYGYPGETFDLEGMTFVVTGLTRERLGDMTDEHAQAIRITQCKMRHDVLPDSF